jgi:hypothetical protein
LSFAGAKAILRILIETPQKESQMNWIFETYSNVYSTAMMQDAKISHNAAAAKNVKSRGLFARLTGRS